MPRRAGAGHDVGRTDVCRRHRADPAREVRRLPPAGAGRAVQPADAIRTRRSALAPSRTSHLRARCRRGCPNRTIRRSSASGGSPMPRSTTLRRWAESGAPAGRSATGSRSAPAPASEWQTGAPDLVLRPAKPFQVKPQSTTSSNDVFRNLVIRTSLPADRFVRAVEFSPGDGLDSPCRPASRSDAGVAAARRPGRPARVRRHGRPWNGGARRTLRRLGARTRAHRLGGRQAVASRAQHRSGAGASPDSRRAIAVRAAGRGALLRRGAGAGGARDDEDGRRGDRHSAGAIGLRDRRSLRAAGGREGPEPVPARALPRTRDGSAERLRQAAPRGRCCTSSDGVFTGSRTIATCRRSLCPEARRSTCGSRTTTRTATRTTRIILRCASRPGQRSTDEMGNLLLQIVPASPERPPRGCSTIWPRATGTRNVAIAEPRVRSTAKCGEPDVPGLELRGCGPRRRRHRGPRAGASPWTPDLRGPINELGGALLKAGRTPDAVRHFQRAARLIAGRSLPAVQSRQGACSRRARRPRPCARCNARSR